MSKKIKRSGVIPYMIVEDEIQMMFMKPSDADYGGDTYQIAKGKHEDGETSLQAGLREASEELGLFVGNVLETHELGTFLGRTTIFVTKMKDKEMFGDPHEETEDTIWMTPEQFYKEGREIHVPVVKAAVRLIKKAEGIK